MALAAMRIELRDVLQKAAAATASSSSSTSAYVHDINRDLHIITGHSLHRERKSGSILQPAIITLLQQQGVACSISRHNVGMLTVKSSALQQYVSE
jgi:hypothetical protein